MGAALALAPAPARAQCAPTATSLETYLRLGPTFSVLGTLEPRPDGLSPSMLLRMGVLAGLPLQFETAFLFTGAQGGSSFALGARILPVAWDPGRGLGLGGGPGHSVGGIVGRSATGGWYFGGVWEWQLLSELILTAEYVVTGGGVLSSPPSFNVGLKAQMPTLREESELVSHVPERPRSFR